MERFREMLLDVWREACRHIEINESATTLAALLAQHLPLSYLLVRRFDSSTQSLSTVAVGQPVPSPLDLSTRTAGTPASTARRRADRTHSTSTGCSMRWRAA